MTEKEKRELEQNNDLTILAASFERIAMRGDKLGEDDLAESVVTEISGLGYIGIEIVRTYDESPVSQYRVDIYKIEGDESALYYRRNFDYLGNVQNEVLTAISDYRNKLKCRDRNEKRRKYRKGESIRSLDELLKQDLVYLRDKITPRAWFLGWKLKMTVEAIERGVIYYAIRKEE